MRGFIDPQAAEKRARSSWKSTQSGNLWKQKETNHIDPQCLDCRIEMDCLVIEFPR